jgi:pimeloyl-ACP methyl ester carboxylesterase
MTPRERTVVFVHGLWMTGHESIFLRRELRRELNAECAVFSYRSVVNDVTANAAELAEFLRSFDTPRLDLVGHSLGGLVILKCLEEHPQPQPGRVVLLGSPLQGSAVARALSRFPLLRAMLGRGIEQEAIPEAVRRWRGQREVGVIAGSLSIGMGRLFAPLPVPNDGTVTVAETQLEGATGHVVLPVSHTGMVYSGLVAQQAAHFLRTGRFDYVPD